jgi:hypothetical protein
MKRAHDAAAWGPAESARLAAIGSGEAEYHVRVGLSNEPDSISRGPDVRLSPGVGAVRVTEAKP